MKNLRPVLGTILCVSLTLGFMTFSGASTHATYALIKGHECQPNYVKSTLTNKVKGKERRYVACVYKAPVKTTAPVKSSDPTTTTTVEPAPTTTTTFPTPPPYIPPATIPTPTISVSITQVNEYSDPSQQASSGNYGFSASFTASDGSTPSGYWSWSTGVPPLAGSSDSFFSGHFMTGTYSVTATFTTYPDSVTGDVLSGSSSYQLVIQ